LVIARTVADAGTGRVIGSGSGLGLGLGLALGLEGYWVRVRVWVWVRVRVRVTIVEQAHLAEERVRVERVLVIGLGL